jgi:hypothetical protein
MGHHLVCFCCIYDGGSSSFPSTNSGNLLTRKLWGKLDDNLKHHLNILRHRICRWIYVHISNILYSVVISTLFGKSYMSSIMFYPFIWSISLPSSVFFKYLVFGSPMVSFYLFIWLALSGFCLDPQNLFPSNCRLQFAGVPCIRSCHSPASHTTRRIRNELFTTYCTGRM